MVICSEKTPKNLRINKLSAALSAKFQDQSENYQKNYEILGIAIHCVFYSLSCHI